MYSKQQHAILAYVQQAVYSSNEQCSKKQQQAVHSSNEQRSKQQQQHKQPYSRTYSKYQHHTTTTTVCSLGPAVAAHYYLYCRI